MLKDWLLFFILAGIWGSSFFLMKHSMFSWDKTPIFSSEQVASIRMIIASAVLLPIGLSKLGYIRTKKVLLALIVVGICGNFLPAFLFTYAQQNLDSGYVGMLNSATPIFTVLISFFAFGQNLTPRQISGLVIGNAGIVLLIFASGDVSFEGSLINVLAVVVATVFYAVSLNIIKYHLAGIRALHITSLAFSMTFIPAVFLFFYFDTPDVFNTNSNASEGFMYASILALFGTVLGVYLYNILIARTSTLFASMVTYGIPCVAMFIGLADGERFTMFQLIALGVILGGIFIANSRKNKQSLVN